ncbi:hypothetical protein Droror1_Dr00025709 [Drosera rotundifolia]
MKLAYDLSGQLPLEQPLYSSLNLVDFLTTKKIIKETNGGEEVYFLKFSNNKKMKLQLPSQFCRVADSSLWTFPSLGLWFSRHRVVVDDEEHPEGDAEMAEVDKEEEEEEEDKYHDDNDDDDEQQAADDMHDDGVDDMSHDDDKEPPAESSRQGAAHQHRHYYFTFEKNMMARMSRCEDRIDHVQSMFRVSLICSSRLMTGT